MLETIWVVTSTALLVFSAPYAYVRGLKKGYVKGGTKVLDEWKAHVREMEEFRDGR